MDKLSYKIKQAVEEHEIITGQKKKPRLLTLFFRAIEYFLKDLWYDYPYVWLCNLKYIIRNIKFFLPHIIHMRDWDQSYQINLFCDSLEYLAYGLKQSNNHIHSQRTYRRCLFAAKRLRAAYDDKSYNDKSYRRLSEINPIRFVKLNNGMSRMTHEYSKRGKEYYNRMLKLICKRKDAIIKEEKKQAWLYLNKYIESFWE
jgi:hypothetical protein